MWRRKFKLRREAVAIWLKFAAYRALSWALSWRYLGRREYVGWACILRNDYLGDFFVSWPALAGLVSWFHGRGLRVLVVTSAPMRDLAAATGLFDAVEMADPRAIGRSLRERLMAYAWARHLAPEVFVSLVCVPEARLGIDDCFARFIAAKAKYGCAMPLMRRKGFRESFFYSRQGNGFYTRLLRAGRASALPAIEAALFQMVTGETLPPAPEFPKLLATLPPSLAGRGYCVVVPGATAPGRRWPIENFQGWAARARGLAPGLLLAVVGTAEEKPLGTARESALPGGAVVNLCGRTNLAELVAVIRGARFVLANETGAAHVAGRLGVPAVCVIGGGHFGLYGPGEHYPTVKWAFRERRCFRCGWDCRYAPAAGAAYPCVAGVTVEDVWEKTEPLLQAAAAPKT